MAVVADGMADGIEGLDRLLASLLALEAEIEGAARARLGAWANDLVRPDFRDGAENLAAYLALRSGDRTRLQAELRLRGLSTLGRSEGHVRATLGAVIATLEGRDAAPTARPAMSEAHAALMREAAALLGTRPPARRTRTMRSRSARAPAARSALSPRSRPSLPSATCRT